MRRSGLRSSRRPRFEKGIKLADRKIDSEPDNREDGAS